MIPYTQPLCESFPSPYYNESHVSFRNNLRNFITKEVCPYINKWEEEGSFPLNLYEKAYKAGVYTPQFPIEYGGQPPLNPQTSNHEWDCFHYLIFNHEIASMTGSGGVAISLWFCTQIGLSPLIKCQNTNNKNQFISKNIIPKLICGKEIVCLAVTEPSGGSDVSRIKTNAIIDKNDKNYFIINGQKMFISNAINSDYFTTLVRLPSVDSNNDNNNNNIKDAFTVFLIPKKLKGVYVSKLKTQGWWSGNTAHITFNNVRIDRKYMVGKQGNGWNIIMENFNLERLAAGAHAIGFSRVCLKDSIEYAKERTTFNKKLIKHQVIRHKIVEMARKIESTYSLLEQISYLYDSKECDEKEISGLVALAKVQATKVLEYCAREALQIFGGRGYIIGGRGARVERIYREVRVAAIGGGSEEILMDFVANQAKL